jgi:hypothetical protein
LVAAVMVVAAAVVAVGTRGVSTMAGGAVVMISRLRWLCEIVLGRAVVVVLVIVRCHQCGSGETRIKRQKARQTDRKR